MLLRVPRSSMRPETQKVRAYAVVDELLAERIRRLIELYPTYGYRLLWAMLRKEGVRVNRKAVYQVLRLKRWLVHQRRSTPRPRVQGRRSQAEEEWLCPRPVASPGEAGG
jgi:putative transposase